MALVRNLADARLLADTLHASIADDADGASHHAAARASGSAQSVLVEALQPSGVAYPAAFVSEKNDATEPQSFLDPTSGTAGNGKIILNWDEAAAQLTRLGTSWSASLGQSAVVTYAYRLSDPGDAIRPGDADGFSQFTAAQIEATEAALRLWADIANITFVRVGSGTTGPGAYSDSAAILFSNYATGLDGSTGWGYYPWPGATGDLQVQGDVWINSSFPEHLTPVFGGYGPHLIAHEIGHAIGLQHPGDYDSTSGQPITYANSAEYWQDSRAYSTMSYFGSGVVGHALGAFSAGPMLHDIAAAQLLYGANMTTRTGDTTYGFNSNTGLQFFTVTSGTDRPIFAVWDAGGIDTFDFSIYTTALEIDLRAEAFSSVGLASNGVDLAIGNISIARGVVIENAIGGSGADMIIGNAANNVLTGNAGADTLVGGLGVDTINGGAGNDIVNWLWGDGNGVIDGGADTDTFNITGSAASNILKVNFNGTALIAAAGNTLTSVELVNANMGGGGDLLEYVAASSGATVNLGTLTASGFASIANIVHVTGGGGNDNLTGDGAANKLTGGDGDDTLSGGDGIDQLFGGNGADNFYGGLGNDSINCDAGNDNVFWFWGDGGDTINGGADTDTVTFTGTAASNLFKIAYDGVKITSVMGNPLSNVEAVIANTGGGGDWLIYKSATVAISVDLAAMTASGLASFSGVSHVQGGSGNDTFTGDALFNKFEGGDGNDVISAGGDNDVLNGGNGNDTLTGGTGIDSINAGDGDDTIIWAWNDGADSVDGGAGTDSITFTGDSAVNLIKASWNGSVLTQVMSSTITSVENVHASGGGGADWLVYSSASAVTANLTTLTASGFASIAGFANLQGGNGNDSLTGDGAANKFVGGDGNDTITGLGGNDTITGGLGNDTFVYAAGAGADTITDFDADATGGQDLLDITGFGITALDFGARVTIFDAGANTIVTIDGSVVITLQGVDGNGDNLVTASDFLLS